MYGDQNVGQRRDPRTAQALRRYSLASVPCWFASGRACLLEQMESVDPFAFVDDDIVEPQGVRDLPGAISSSALERPMTTEAVETDPSPTSRPADRLAKSEQYFKEVAKADGSEVPQFLSDVMAWASTTNGANVDAEADKNDHDKPPRRSYAEEKAAARESELKATAAREAAEAAKAAAVAKLSEFRHKAPLGTIQIEDAGRSQVMKHGTPSASYSPPLDRKRNGLDCGQAASGGSAVKTRPPKTKRAMVRPAAKSPTSAIKKASHKQTAASLSTAREAKTRRPRHLVESSPEPAEPEVRVRSTRRGRRAIAPLPWWTAAGNAAASKRSLNAAALAAAVSAARVM